MAKHQQLLRSSVCLWINNPDLDTAIAVARDMRGSTRSLALGPGFFLANGPPGVRCFFELGGIQDIMLDMRLLGSPEEIWQCVTEAAKMGVHSITVHAMAGARAIKVAVEAAEASKQVTFRVRRPHIFVSLLPGSLDNAELVDDLQLRVRRRGHVQQVAKQLMELGADGLMAEFQDMPHIRRVSRKIPMLVFAQRGARNYRETLHEEDKKLAGITEVLQAHARHVLFDSKLVHKTDVEWASDMVLKEVQQVEEGDSHGRLLGSDLLGSSLRHA